MFEAYFKRNLSIFFENTDILEYKTTKIWIIFSKFASQIVTARKTRCSKGSPTPKGEGGNEHLGIRRFCALVLTIWNLENFISVKNKATLRPLGVSYRYHPDMRGQLMLSAYVWLSVNQYTAWALGTQK